MSVTRVLLTGFEPFDKSKLNPSMVVVERLRDSGFDGIDLRCAVLPVGFVRAETALLEELDRHQPQIVICLGQAEGRSSVTPERIAVNLDDARIADNDGNTPVDVAIVSDGPDAYFSTLPVRAIVDAMVADGLPAALSLSAGTFVCNHVFYVLQHALRDRDVRSGFIHVPLMEEQAADFPGLPTMPIAGISRAIGIAIRVSASANIA